MPRVVKDEPSKFIKKLRVEEEVRLEQARILMEPPELIIHDDVVQQATTTWGTGSIITSGTDFSPQYFNVPGRENEVTINISGDNTSD